MQTAQDSRLAADSALAHIRAEQLTADVACARAASAEAIVQQLRPALIDADFEARQTILRLLVERIVAHGQHLEVQLALPMSGNFDLTFKDHTTRCAAEPLEGMSMAREPGADLLVEDLWGRRTPRQSGCSLVHMMQTVEHWP
jgi:hypothetical protein